MSDPNDREGAAPPSVPTHQTEAAQPPAAAEPQRPAKDYVAAVLAEAERKKASIARLELGESIGNQRRALFRRVFADPIAGMVEPWGKGWSDLAEHLRGGRIAEAAAELRALAQQLRTFQTTTEALERELAAWFETHAVPFNEAGPNEAPFGRGWFQAVDEGSWQVNLPWKNGGPLNIPPRMIDFHLFEQAKRGASELFEGAQALLVGIVEPNSAEQLLSLVQEKALVASVAELIAIVIFPAPSLVERWFATERGDDEILAARLLLHGLPDKFGRVLRLRLEAQVKGLRGTLAVSDTACVSGTASPAEVKDWLPAPLPAVQEQPPENVSVVNNTNSKAGPKKNAPAPKRKRGRPPLDRDDARIKKENKLYRDWKASGSTRKQFLSDRGIDEEDGLAQLERARKRIPKAGK